MPVIKLKTSINAPVERVFDLSRSIDLHIDSMSHTDEKPIAGKMKGLINLGETVTWEATHFGIRQQLTSRITICERPFKFGDIMVSGVFARFDHEHLFTEIEGQTLMTDIFDYDSPLGFLGKLADLLFWESYMTGLLQRRNETIKRVAESDEWKMFLC